MNPFSIEHLREQQKKAYRAQPLDMRAHYNREERIMDEYKGRQLLELLQNADDAAQDKDQPYTAKILFHLQDDGLLIANTGIPFSSKGIESLIIADRSPKQLESDLLIGCKGLGFRSVLSWSKSPLILSGDLEFCFDPEFARQEAFKLAEELPDLKEEIDSIYQKMHVYPVPILRFPKLPDSSQTAYLSAQKLRQQGYDTVIFLPLSSDNELVLNDVRQQLYDLWGESILFCRNIEELLIELDSQQFIWHIDRQQQEKDKSLIQIKSILPNEEPYTVLWTVYKKQAQVPKHCFLPDKYNQTQFEIAVAICDDQDLDYSPECYLSMLHVFFPTQLYTGLKLLQHATLDLTDSRNHLIENPSNKYIISELVQLTVKALEKHQAERAPYTAYNIFSEIHNCHADLKSQKWGYLNAFKTYIPQALLFHSFDMKLNSLNQLSLPESMAFYEILEPQYFSNLIYPPPNQDIYQELKKHFEVPILERSAFLSLLAIQCENASPSQIGTILASLVQGLPNYESIAYHQTLSKLLRDHDGNCINEDTLLYVMPEHEINFQLPNWANGLKFLHPDLLLSFKKKLNLSHTHDALRRLQSLGLKKIHGYNLNSILAFLYSESHLSEALSKQEQVLDVLTFLYAIHKEDKLTIQLDEVYVINQYGEPSKVKDTYMGTPYQQGKLIQAYFKGQDKISFLAHPKQIAFEATHEELEDFFIRLGVKIKIETVQKNINHWYLSSLDQKYLDSFFQSQNYPYHLKEQQVIHHVFNTVEDFKKAEINHQFELNDIPKGFEKALEKADAETIISWLLTQKNKNLLIPFIKNIGNYKFIYGRLQHSRYDLTAQIPNFVYFLLTHIAWLPDEQGQRSLPRELKFPSKSKQFTEMLSQKEIKLRFTHPLLKAHSKSSIEALLKEIGVVSSFEEMSERDIYSSLLNHPVNDPDGKHCVWFYRKLIDTQREYQSCSEQQQFFNEGFLWAVSQGKASYFPVSECRYNARSRLPRALEKVFPIPLLEMDQRKSTSKIQTILGVKELTDEDFNIFSDPQKTKFHSMAETINALIQKRLEDILILRLHQLKEIPKDEINILKHLNIQVCTQIGIIFEFGNEKESLTLTEPEDYIWISTDKEEKHSLLLLNYDKLGIPQAGDFIWFQVAAGLADALHIPGETDTFAQILSASSPEQILKFRVRNSYSELSLKAKDLLDSNSSNKKALTYFSPKKQTVKKTISKEEQSVSNSLNEQENTELEKSQNQQLEINTSLELIKSKQKNLQAQKKLVTQQKIEVIQTSSKPKPSIKRDLVITQSPSGSASRKEKSLVDEKTTLLVVEEFEKSQGRFPFDVSHIRGTQGFGCDMISFETEESVHLVQNESKIDLDNIIRWIEVKGSSQRTGEIKLTPNEEQKAAEMNEKYFIYRVFQISETQFELQILANPLHSDARRHVYDFKVSTQVESYELNF